MRKNKKIQEAIIGIGFKLVKVTPLFLLKKIWNFFDRSEDKLAILFRYLFMKKYCKKIGDRVFIGKTTNIKNYHNLSLGSNVSIHSFTYIDAYGGIDIDDNVSIANHSTIISSDHTWSDTKVPIKYNQVIKKPIIIKKDVWIASGVKILGNVTINSRSVVGAGAVITKNIDENSLNVGIPSRKIRDLSERG